MFSADKQNKEVDSQQRARRIGFLEKWAKVEEVNTYLGLTLWGVGLICTILLFALVKVINKPQPIYYIPGANKAGIAYPNQIEEGSVTGFASSWLLNWANFTPATIEDVYSRAIKYMAPSLLSKTRARLDDEMKKVRMNNISSLFSLTEEPRVEENPNGYTVILKGEKVIYVGKESITTQRILYKVYLKKVPPTQSNPYGMVVADLEQKERIEK